MFISTLIDAVAATSLPAEASEGNNSSSSFGLFSSSFIILMGIVGYVMYFVKDTLEEFVFRLFFFMLDLSDADQEFAWFFTFFSFHPYTTHGSSHIKPYQKKANKVNDYDDDPLEYDGFDLGKDAEFKKTKFVPAPGYHVIYIEGKPLLINMISTMPNNGNVMKAKENVEIYKPRYDFIDRILQLIVPCNEDNNCEDPLSMAKRAGLNTSSFLSQRYDKSNTTNSTTNSTATTSQGGGGNKVSSCNYFKDLMANCYYINTLYMKSKTTIYTQNYGRWTASCVKHKRDKNSVILDNGVWESLYSDVEQFLNARDWYFDQGIPYRRGYLLYGPPGTGKSSTIGSIAAAFNMNICVVNLASKELSDEDLNSMFSSAPIDALIVLEDIDSSFMNSAPEDKKSTTNKRKKDSEEQVVEEEEEEKTSEEGTNVIQTKSQVTFSGILNAIDGIAAQESRMIFMTTNYKDKLPPALIRNGRVDKKIFIGFATEYQVKSYVKKFYEKEKLAKEEFTTLVDQFWNKIKHLSICMAQLQGFLLLYRHSLKDVVEAADEFEKFTKDEI